MATKRKIGGELDPDLEARRRSWWWFLTGPLGIAYVLAGDTKLVAEQVQRDMTKTVGKRVESEGKKVAVSLAVTAAAAFMLWRSRRK